MACLSSASDRAGWGGHALTASTRPTGQAGRLSHYIPQGSVVTHLGVDAAENLYLTGTTESRDAQFDSFTVAATGQSSAFLAKLSSSRSAVVNPEHTREGDLRFQVLGTAGLTNLVTWTRFTEFVSQRSSTTVLVPASPTGPPRYYRASAK